MDIDNLNLDHETKNIISYLLKKSKNNILKVENIWELVDIVWDEINCDNKAPELDKLSRFYSHPVWLLNGLFIEQHELSMQHRHAISDWIIKKRPKRVLDYGGGIGTLARLIADKDATIKVDVYEPYPTAYAISKAVDYSNISFISSIEKEYDCIISYTILEHVIDPLKLFSVMVAALRKDGYMIVANDFSPVVKCHLPSNFHLRYTFNKLAQLMGLELEGPCKGSPAIIYRKQNTISFEWKKLRFYEQISRLLFPFLKIAHFGYGRLNKLKPIEKRKGS